MTTSHTPNWKQWWLRLATVHFVLTSLTGLALYFRPLEHRAGAYSNQTKEWLVMLHNGEWLSELLFGNRYVSGLMVGVLLSSVVWWSLLRRRGQASR